MLYEIVGSTVAGKRPAYVVMRRDLTGCRSRGYSRINDADELAKWLNERAAGYPVPDALAPYNLRG